MLDVDPSRQVRKFLRRLARSQPKHARQIALKIQQLREDPEPPDAAPLRGKATSYLRADCGEYRIVYRVEGNTLMLYVVARRNDDEVYRLLRRRTQ